MIGGFSFIKHWLFRCFALTLFTLGDRFRCSADTFRTSGDTFHSSAKTFRTSRDTFRTRLSYANKNGCPLLFIIKQAFFCYAQRRGVNKMNRVPFHPLGFRQQQHRSKMIEGVIERVSRYRLQ